MTATVSWEYGSGLPRHLRPPQPPPKVATVEIPEYTEAARVQVHFYPEHRVKVVVTQYGLGHPCHPLPQESWAPWTLNEATARNDADWIAQQIAQGKKCVVANEEK